MIPLLLPWAPSTCQARLPSLPAPWWCLKLNGCDPLARTLCLQFPLTECSSHRPSHCPKHSSTPFCAPGPVPFCSLSPSNRTAYSCLTFPGGWKPDDSRAFFPLLCLFSKHPACTAPVLESRVESYCYPLDRVVTASVTMTGLTRLAEKEQCRSHSSRCYVITTVILFAVAFR